jgi:hypothetical protein
MEIANVSHAACCSPTRAGVHSLRNNREAAANPFRLRQISACELAHDLSPAFLLVGPH